jgi:hypothetical protein
MAEKEEEIKTIKIYNKEKADGDKGSACAFLRGNKPFSKDLTLEDIFFYGISSKKIQRYI